jgi:replicative DNA helicase
MSETLQLEIDLIAALLHGDAAGVDAVVRILGRDGRAFNDRELSGLYSALVREAETRGHFDVGMALSALPPDEVFVMQRVCQEVSPSVKSAAGEAYALELNEAFRRRDALAKIAALSACLERREMPVAGIVGALAQVQDDLSEHAPNIRTHARTVEAALELLLRQADGDPRALGIPTGLPQLSKLCSGWKPGDLIVIGARTSIGKSALALHFALTAARADIPALVISLEMTAEELDCRLLTAMADVPSECLTPNGFRKDECKERVRRAAEELKALPLHIVDDCHGTPADIRARARRFKRECGAGLVVVDYMQIMNEPNERERYAKFCAISASMKQLAKELRCPVMLLSQLSRAAAQVNENELPQLHHLKESGALEQDADIVLLAHKLTPKQQEDMRAAIGASFDPLKWLPLILAKQRRGPVGDLMIMFDRSTQRISDPTAIVEPRRANVPSPRAAAVAAAGSPDAGTWSAEDDEPISSYRDDDDDMPF